MNTGGSSHRAGRRSHRQLLSRSHPARTFRSLAAFLALLFLSGGIYLVAEPLVHPVTEHDIGVIAGAFAIALASILLFYLVRPAGGCLQVPVERQEKSVRPFREVAAAAKERNPGPINLPPARIRPAAGLRN